ncbi:hypothetical protein GF357_02645, partial [Candidatus Dojkabacteria bacterium]|nr:hypothetical protein [Candidatus Dojkabacteria bacterium]
MKKAYKKLEKFLKKNEIPFGEVEHDPAGNAMQYHKVLSVEYEKLVKAILLKFKNQKKDELAVVIVQANKQVDLEQMRILLDAKEIRLATDKELKDATDCDSGELHPFGSIYGAKALMDQDLLKQEKIYFRAGLRDVSFTVAPERLKDSEEPIMFTEVNVIDENGEQVVASEKTLPTDDEAESIEMMRHSAAHVLAHAVLKLHPDAKIGIGPAIENGFYYDFEFVEPINEEDLEEIEKEMNKIIKKDIPIRQEFKSRAEAKKFYTNWEQDYKLDLLNEIKDKKISFFITGENDFIDMCRGPHIESTGKIGVVKLMRIAGAYWKGDENNPMLTRIYGVAFNTQEELDNHLAMIEEAKRRNHRKIGKDMELFAVFPEVGQGLPVWLPNGYVMRRTLEDYMIKMERRYGYVHALSPHINKSELFEISGHLDFYKESMYAPIKIDDEEYYLKPMNCPVSMLMYKMKPRSYRDLPMKLGELGTVYRYEKSGELHGLQRV